MLHFLVCSEEQLYWFKCSTIARSLMESLVVKYVEDQMYEIERDTSTFDISTDSVDARFSSFLMIEV